MILADISTDFSGLVFLLDVDGRLEIEGLREDVEHLGRGGGDRDPFLVLVEVRLLVPLLDLHLVLLLDRFLVPLLDLLQVGSTLPPGAPCAAPGSPHSRTSADPLSSTPTPPGPTLAPLPHLGSLSPQSCLCQMKNPLSPLV